MKYTGEWHMIRTVEDLPELGVRALFITDKKELLKVELFKGLPKFFIERIIDRHNRCGKRLLAWTELPLPEVKDG